MNGAIPSKPKRTHQDSKRKERLSRIPVFSYYLMQIPKPIIVKRTKHIKKGSRLVIPFLIKVINEPILIVVSAAATTAMIRA
jgi:hypothetical protein